MSDLRACTACGMLQAYPMPVCRQCQGRDFTLCNLPMQAEVYSRTTVSRAPNPAFQAQVPYTVALLRGPKGGLMLMRLESDVAIGGMVTVRAEGDSLVAR
jgi:uncharacterized OB-fold protein